MDVLDMNWNAVTEVLKKYYLLSYSLSSQCKIDCLLNMFFMI